jgi:pyruvate/2-oxoglutarate dehydrogenase complex dihydrolipoamide acyltransferase (E2) component
MKKTYIILLAAGLTLAAAGQKTPSDYLRMIPQLPKDSCGTTRAGVDLYTQLVETLINQLENDISARDRTLSAGMANNEAAAKENALKQMSQMYGMSQEDIDKIRNSKNMSAADKQAMANKMVQQQTNMSMDEIKNLQKMSDAGKKAYTEAYAAEAMAVSQADPKAQANQSASNSTFDMVREQQEAQNRVSAISQKIAGFYLPVESDPEALKMIRNIETWQAKINSMIGVDYGQGKQMDSLALLVKTEKIRYCNRFSPKYRTALRQHLALVKSTLPDYRHLGEVTAKVTSMQTGTGTPEEVLDLPSLQSIRSYLEKLKDVYKYNLYFPEDD